MTLVNPDTEFRLLADPQRLADVRKVAFDENDFHAVEVLRQASAYFRRATSQEITLHEEDTQELIGAWGTDIWLPQRPVLNVTAVAVRACATDEFVDRTAFRFHRRGLLSDVYPWEGPGAVVRVTYDHGYEIVPEDVQAAVLSMAARRYGSVSSGVVTSVTLGSFSESYATDASGSPIGLTDFEAQVIEAYKPKDA